MKVNVCVWWGGAGLRGRTMDMLQGCMYKFNEKTIKGGTMEETAFELGLER